MRRLIAAALLLAASAVGCASSHTLLAIEAPLARSGLITDRKEVSKLEKSLTDADIAAMLDANVAAKLPSPVAIARLESNCSGYQPFLANISAEEMVGWEKTVAGVSSLTGVVPVSPLSHGSSNATLHSLRAAAARMDCELLLVYISVDSAVDNYNDSAVLYWTLVGLWTVPGNVYEHRTVCQGLLLDCRTGMILGTCSGDDHVKQAYPAMYKSIQEDKLPPKTRAKALKDLQDGFAKLAVRLDATRQGK